MAWTKLNKCFVHALNMENFLRTFRNFCLFNADENRSLETSVERFRYLAHEHNICLA